VLLKIKNSHWVWHALLLTLSFAAWPSYSGLGPHQVILVYDQEVPQSVEIAQTYAALRDIPSSHLCPVQVQEMSGRQIAWERFEDYWRPTIAACVNRHTYETVWAFALSSHLPHRVALLTDGHSLSMTAALQSFFLNEEGAPFVPQAHALAGDTLFPAWPNPSFVGNVNPTTDFEERETGDTNYNATSSLVRSLLLPSTDSLFIATDDFSGQLSFAFHLEGLQHADGMALLENAIAGEVIALEERAFVGMRGVSDARQVRDPETQFLAKVLDQKGRTAQFISEHDGALLPENIVGFFTGAQWIHDVFPFLDLHPAAMVDNVTSYGAVDANWVCTDDGCPENEVQTAIGHLIALGASQVHGTVDEPLNNSFPNAGAYYLYDAGYTAAESWLYNQPYLLWQNAYWGDGLAAPFSERPVIQITTQNATVTITATHSLGIEWMGLFEEGEKVNETDLETLIIAKEALGTGGLLVVAQAQAFEERHDGLKVSAQVNRSHPMGWKRFEKETLSWKEPPSSTLLDAKGCQCRSGAHSGTWVGGVLFFALCFYARQRKRV
jgi:hypothetical protein